VERDASGRPPREYTSSSDLREVVVTNQQSLRVALGLLGDAMNHGPSEPVFSLIAEARDTIESALPDEPEAPRSACCCADGDLCPVHGLGVNRPCSGDGK